MIFQKSFYAAKYLRKIIFLSGFFEKVKKKKNITNVLTVTFDQFNATLLNKSINLFQIKIKTSNRPRSFEL